MKKLIFIGLIALTVYSCKTTEANYRAAYEKTMEARAGQEIDDDNLFGGVQRQMKSSYVVTGSDSIPVSFQYISVVADGDNTPAEMKKYNVVAGQFKQKFNAFSLCRRIKDSGWPDAFIVQTSEPYYYIVAATFDSASDAAAAMKKIRQAPPLEIKPPLPFILSDPRK